ncbi:MAG: putative methyltransferase [Prokaryotic dsDNA virus sp.]|nr:MAG: putative methyltransferase [Prokaryotic dsDNA virus sp.]QDP56772.1 MAG: putative methyltransferase [Prokaryotic dsDNA virus sp.]QDP63779.1 MAG: putative methyltransferase [Prokaryotic dsDNA virus sp.]QDP63877.1 MAG: putative methyltransferase [Prokaryotic dsDNA virus sp.]|tara:strand:- start:22229 stop:22831 length:603 start_codon:yes stop_codon:yes gene_type:complete
MIKSVYENQIDILKSIMTLCNIERFDVDVTFGNGMFYKDIQKPVHCFDIDPALVDTPASSDNLPLGDKSVSSLIFDPPFLTYVRAAREGNGDMVMAKRFGGYWRYDELETHYRETLTEAARVLKKKGVMVFKCQDIIHNHKMHCTHANVINWAAENFRLKDLFILPAKTRMAIPQQKGTKKKVQKHARIFHSYFLVLERH